MTGVPPSDAMSEAQHTGVQAIEVRLPHDPPAPVVFDSPHSGAHYPEDFRHAVSQARIRRMEDAFVDELFAGAPAHGASLLRALFPRAYIDPNRRPDDIDVDLLQQSWPGEVNPSAKVKMGIGLFARRDLMGALYDRRLSVAEVESRLASYYWPYHKALKHLLDEAHARFNAVWHVNCHSMKSAGGGPKSVAGRQSRADFCIGDRDGSSCNAAFTELVVECLRGMGYKVAVNDPYKGVELVSRYSAPATQRHSVQIEINRALYMDEIAVTKHDGFDVLANNLSTLAAQVCEFARVHSSDSSDTSAISGSDN